MAQMLEVKSQINVNFDLFFVSLPSVDKGNRLLLPQHCKESFQDEICNCKVQFRGLNYQQDAST